jgi:ATP-dependent RNA helicase RhlE
VLALLSAPRQNLLFSATFSDEIRALANGLLRDPLTVEVSPRNTPAELVEHRVHLVTQGEKRAVLSHLLREGATPQTLVFTRTKALADFKDYKVQVLVATDIAARGLDISELPQVVNYELPHVPEDYVHRIGRTGRAGCAGQALSLVSDDERDRLRAIERVLGRKIQVLPLDRSAIRIPAQDERPADPRVQHHAQAKPASRAHAPHPTRPPRRRGPGGGRGTRSFGGGRSRP